MHRRVLRILPLAAALALSAAPAVAAPADQEVLPKGWQQSEDRAWATEGDSTGFRLMVADAKAGYAWRTAASLAEPGFDTDAWIGNVCFTGSGRRAVVVYAPRQFTNHDDTFQRGGFAAVVDLADGKVTKLGTTVSLAYHNPGCGTDETAVLAQNGGTKLGRTKLHVLDTATGRMVRSQELPGQITSAIPLGDRIVAADGAGVVEIDPLGGTKKLTGTAGAPSYLRADSDGGVAFLEVPDDNTAVAKHLAAGARDAKEIARGPLTELGLSAGKGGRVFLTGKPSDVKALPRTVRKVAASPRSELSSMGQVEVSQAREGSLEARMTESGKTARFQVAPDAAPAAASPSTNPVDDDRTCAVQRNDPGTQVFQPHWKQVEWAVDLAVQDALNVERPANWNQSGIPGWRPQAILPPIPLEGGGKVPAQIMLGILAQESNLWQASSQALEGMTGNPLVGDFYGRRASSTDEWAVNWAEADCGYGVAQVTDGMRKGQMAEFTQRAIALDYATNIAAGLRILQEKWNQTYRAGIKMNNADPSKIENWFTALWAYNSGINPQGTTGNTTGCTPGPSCTDSRGNWGLGWTNNPANPDYPKTRAPFLESPSDAKTPQRWPYPEKVIGWAAYPIIKYDFRKSGNDAWAAGYNQAWWSDNVRRANAKPPVRAFCDASNHCDGARTQPCGESDYHCWWNKPVTWKPDCADSCGNADIRFPTDYPEPVFALQPSEEAARKMPVEHYRPNCDPFDTDEGGVNKVPADALIVDNVADSVNSVRRNCLRNWVNKGSFAFDFAQDASGQYRSKIDLHQLGGGLGGHFWFGTTRKKGQAMDITGTWTLNQPLDKWARVLVHLPSHSAHTQQAAYKIDLGNGDVRDRVVPQRVLEHKWVSLGVFKFNGTPKVSLSNITNDGEGNEKVAWDAIAFQPLPGKPKNIVVSLGDSYSSGEGASTDAAADYYRETDNTGGDVVGPSPGDPGYKWVYGNACHRSKFAWSRRATFNDSTTSIGARSDNWDANVEHQLLACSGARTQHLLPSEPGQAPRKGRFRELTQLDRGYLDENTTLVTLTIGGNDAGFTDVLKKCIMSVGEGNCQDEPLDASQDTRPLKVTGPEGVRTKVIPAVESVLRAIHTRAPNAIIVLLGYPKLISAGGVCVGTTIIVDGVRVPIGLNPSEATWIGESSDYLDGQLNNLVSALSLQLNAPITYGDPRQAFEGKGACGNPESIHSAIVSQTEGETSQPVSQQSFHPNKNGTALYADVLNGVLRTMGR